MWFQQLNSLLKNYKIKGFCDVLVVSDILQGISCLVQVLLKVFYFFLKLKHVINIYSKLYTNHQSFEMRQNSIVPS